MATLVFLTNSCLLNFVNLNGRVDGILMYHPGVIMCLYEADFLTAVWGD